MNLQQYVDKLKLYLFDMDGTLYLGNRLYPFTVELLETIKKTGGRYRHLQGVDARVRH